MMKRLMAMILAVGVIGLAGNAHARGRGSYGKSRSRSSGDVYVNPHTTSNGTPVKGHYRTAPNNTGYDNYSTQGNVNPHTGKIGTKKAYR